MRDGYVILSRGRNIMLQVDPIMEKYLIGRGIAEVFILQTEEAIQKYTELVNEGKKVCGFIHTTC